MTRQHGITKRQKKYILDNLDVARDIILDVFISQMVNNMDNYTASYLIEKIKEKKR